MKKQFSIVGVSLIVLGLGSATVYGQQRFVKGGEGRAIGGGSGMMLPLLLRGIGLTAEQKAQVQKIVAGHHPTFRELSGQLRAAQEELASKLFAPGELQEGDLLPQLQRVAHLRNQLTQEGLKVVLEIRSVLTPEQLAKAERIKERMQALRTEMRSLFEGNH